MFCRKNNKRKKLGIVTLYLLIRLKYWMYKEQAKRYSTIEWLYDVITTLFVNNENENYPRPTLRVVFLNFNPSGFDKLCKYCHAIRRIIM